MAKNISAKASFLDEIDRHFDYIGNYYDEPNHQVLELSKRAKAFCQSGELDQIDRTIQCYQAILQLCQELNDRHGEGISYIKLGCAYGKWCQRFQEQGLAGREAQIACRSRLEDAAYYCDQGIQFFGIRGAHWEELAALMFLRGVCSQGLACLEDHEEWAREYWGKVHASYAKAQYTLTRIEDSEWEKLPWQEHVSKAMDEATEEFGAGLEKKRSKPSQLILFSLCPEAKYLRSQQEQPHDQQWKEHKHIATWNLCVEEDEFLLQKTLSAAKEFYYTIGWQVKDGDEIDHELGTNTGDLLLIKRGRFTDGKFHLFQKTTCDKLEFPVVVKGDKIIVFPVLTSKQMTARENEDYSFVGQVIAILKRRR